MRIYNADKGNERGDGSSRDRRLSPFQNPTPGAQKPRDTNPSHGDGRIIRNRQHSKSVFIGLLNSRIFKDGMLSVWTKDLKPRKVVHLPSESYKQAPKEKWYTDFVYLHDISKIIVSTR